jgi:hypothetical protein
MLLMTGVIGFELWNIATGPDWSAWPVWAKPVAWLCRSAAIIHLVEGIGAALWIYARNEPDWAHPLRYGIYTFFVGTVGLQELAEARECVDGDRNH